MSNLEELARLRVNEALQSGIQAQRIHRALTENREKSAKSRVRNVTNLRFAIRPRELGVFRALQIIFLKIAGYFA